MRGKYAHVRMSEGGAAFMMWGRHQRNGKWESDGEEETCAAVLCGGRIISL
jgi:hypothetical protein